jgi:hypothetical protein
MRYLQLIENNDTLYHGDNFGTTSLDPKWMLHNDSNNQVGVGIYFSPDINVAKTYEPKISSISRQGLKIVESRQLAIDHIDLNQAAKFTKALNDANEDFWYVYSDYGIEVAEPEDVEDYHHVQLQEMMLREEIRNWQLEMAERSDNINVYVNAWNQLFDIDGLYETDSQFYSIINTNVQVTPVNF